MRKLKHLNMEATNMGYPLNHICTVLVYIGVAGFTALLINYHNITFKYTFGVFYMLNILSLGISVFISDTWDDMTKIYLLHLIIRFICWVTYGSLILIGIGAREVYEIFLSGIEKLSTTTLDDLQKQDDPVLRDVGNINK